MASQQDRITQMYQTYRTPAGVNPRTQQALEIGKAYRNPTIKKPSTLSKSEWDAIKAQNEAGDVFLAAVEIMNNPEASQKDKGNAFKILDQTPEGRDIIDNIEAAGGRIDMGETRTLTDSSGRSTIATIAPTVSTAVEAPTEISKGLGAIVKADVDRLNQDKSGLGWLALAQGNYTPESIAAMRKQMNAQYGKPQESSNTKPASNKLIARMPDGSIKEMTGEEAEEYINSGKYESVYMPNSDTPLDKRALLTTIADITGYQALVPDAQWSLDSEGKNVLSFAEDRAVPVNPYTKSTGLAAAFPVVNKTANTRLPTDYTAEEWALLQQNRK